MLAARSKFKWVVYKGRQPKRLLASTDCNACREGEGRRLQESGAQEDHRQQDPKTDVIEGADPHFPGTEGRRERGRAERDGRGKGGREKVRERGREGGRRGGKTNRGWRERGSCMETLRHMNVEKGAWCGHSPFFIQTFMVTH